jgi:hypothetical protein
MATSQKNISVVQPQHRICIGIDASCNYSNYARQKLCINLNTTWHWWQLNSQHGQAIKLAARSGLGTGVNKKQG